MGYSTNFTGRFNFNRPLTVPEFRQLESMADYHKQGEGYLKNFTDTPDRLPDSYLQWQPTEDGQGLEWNGGEKFYEYVHWLRWLIKHYFMPRDIVLNGDIQWQGEETGDIGILRVIDNKVTSHKLKVQGMVECPSCGHNFVPEEIS